MKIIEDPPRKSAGTTYQSEWLQATISGADEKTRAIFNLLEDSDSALQSTEVYERRKEAVTELVKDICKSYSSLAEKYESLRRDSGDALNSGSSSPSNNRSSQHNRMKHKEASGSWGDSELEVIESNPESTVEDADIECEVTNSDPEHLKTIVHNLIPEDENLVPKEESSIKPENVWSNRLNVQFSKLVEENTQLQVELIRRNTEKRHTISKLQNQVSILMAENNTLQRQLSYYDRNKQQIQVTSPSRKLIHLDRLFTCYS